MGDESSSPGPITCFLVRLAEEEGLAYEFALNPAQVIENDDSLSKDDAVLLLSHDFGKIQERVREEAASSGEKVWVVIWVRRRH